MTNLAGKSIVVTGAGRGLGAAYARLAAREGAAVVVNDVTTAAEDVAEGIRSGGGRAQAHVADISGWEDSGALIDACIARFGGIDGLINNAGVFHMAVPEEESRERIERIVRVNILGTMHCGLHALRAMRHQGRGAVLNVTSGAYAGYAEMAIYGATKGAVASLTYGWACDVAGTGVRVNAIAPIARTAMYDQMLDRRDTRETGGGGDIRPEDNAAIAIYLLSDRAVGVNGQIVRVDSPRLSLMSHPGEIAPPAACGDWTVDAVARAFETEFADRLQPLGVHPAAGVIR